jgi:hypothetical protein
LAKWAKPRFTPVKNAFELAGRLIDDEVGGAEVTMEKDHWQINNSIDGTKTFINSVVKTRWEGLNERFEVLGIFVT